MAIAPRRTRRTKAEIDALTDEEREAFEAKREAARAPKDAYLIYSIENGSGEALGSEYVLNIVSATRDANEVLKQTSGQVEKRYQHFMIK